LAEAGVPIQGEHELVTPLDTLVYHLNQNGYRRVYLAASPTVRTWITAVGIEHVEDDPELVVLCRDTTLDYQKMSRLCQMVHKGIPYIASNGDSYYPTPHGPALDLAGMIEMIVATTRGIQPLRVFGKPHPALLESVARPHGISPEHVLMIGDRLNTDIQMAANFGCDSVVVLTGETDREKLLMSPVRPTHVAEGAHILNEQLQTLKES
jgi:ribonucleotide monophosphatase NagD (HAD superfamily)